tara:strand:+ start:5350 stop:6567 length:1218 start_codon:yes stop_codon:yes gene_type:complete
MVKNKQVVTERVPTGDEEFTSSLIKSINQTLKEKRAFNLNSDDSPTNVKRFISTGSVLLDYIISNRKNGGFPEGRLVEIAGASATGKSFIAIQALAETQKIGGIAVYIDTENATDRDLLGTLGVNIDELVYLQPRTVEDVFKSIEHIIKKIKENDIDRPVTVVWDSVAATPPKAELDGDYDTNTVGLGARRVSQGLRKIIDFIGENRITLIFVNQLKMKIGAGLYEDPWVTPYGKAIPFHASVRLRLTRKRTSDVKEDKTSDADYLGVGVKAKVIKNKICPPFRTCEFTIGFYQGVLEHEQLYDKIVAASPLQWDNDNNTFILNAMKGAWHKAKLTKVLNDNKVIELIPEFKFRKKDIASKFFDNENLKSYLPEAIDNILRKEYTKQEVPEFDIALTDEILEEID